MPSRRDFLSVGVAAGAASLLPPPLAAHAASPGAPPASAAPVPDLTAEDVAHAERVIGLEFRPDQRELLLPDAQYRLGVYETIRQQEPANSVAPVLSLDLPAPPAPRGPMRTRIPARVTSTPSETDLAFASIPELAALLRARRVSSVELTQLALDRLQRFDPQLKATVSLLEERALRTARQRDEDLARGVDLGPLHGIPYGAKDLLAARGAPTTWGARPFRDQRFEEDAAVVELLDAAGAVLVAKLTLGALAWGDVWFGGRTNNPWNVEQGSSGSSAGPGAAVAAGLVPFAIGSETYGSIVSPSTRNGVTGHRPTFGRVPTRGAMALAWSLDKLGPMARSAEDAAIVFDAVRDVETDHGDLGFPFDPAEDLRGIRLGYVPVLFDEAEGAGGDADRESLRVLRDLGADLVPVALPDGPEVSAVMDLTVTVEAAAAFDGLTRSGRVDELVRQERFAWPNTFRHGRLIPAVEYLNAQRIRRRLADQTEAVLQEVHALVTPSVGGTQLALTNLTGHPAVAVPNGFFPLQDADPADPRRQPHSLTFVGRLYADHAALRAAHAYQRATAFHRMRPPVGG
ncbi:MAG TPA: amidase [Bacteroidetes bacterium]|nr:amidase [Bacteroidota bacterium]HIL57113.1 amidase [Rhodothermales bacterium]